MRVSRVGAEVNSILCPRQFPSPNHPLVIGKKRTFAGDPLFHEQGGFGTFAREASNLFQMPMVVEHIRKDHSIPGREGHL